MTDDSKAILAKCEFDGNCTCDFCGDVAETNLHARLLPIITKLLEDRARLREALNSIKEWNTNFSRNVTIEENVFTAREVLAASDALVKEIL